MSAERLLLDTAFVQALLNRRDQYHPRARALLPRVRQATEVWVTEAVLVEVGNAFGSYDRAAAAQFVSQCYQTANMRVVSVVTVFSPVDCPNVSTKAQCASDAA